MFNQLTIEDPPRRQAQARTNSITKSKMSLSPAKTTVRMKENGATLKTIRLHISKADTRAIIGAKKFGVREMKVIGRTFSVNLFITKRCIPQMELMATQNFTKLCFTHQSSRIISIISRTMI